MYRFPQTKLFLAFLLAFGFGTLCFRAVEHERIFTFDNVFSKTEAIGHFHKNVKSLCNSDYVRIADTNGRTVSVERNRRNEYNVVIDWEYSPRGRSETIWYDKKVYEKCIREIKETR